MRATIHKTAPWRLLPAVLAACVLAGNAEARTVAVLVTRDAEIEALAARFGHEGEPPRRSLAGREVALLASPDGSTVAAARCGAGLVNAVITAQALIDAFQPDLLVSVGLCAAVNDTIRIGDLLLADVFDRHDIGTHTDAGFVHGTAWYRKTRLEAASLMPDGTWSSLVARAQSRVDAPILPVCLVSGDSFIRSPYKRAWLRGKLEADAVDMSGAAIAAVAEANRVPLVVLRQVSDLGDTRAGERFAASAGQPADALAAAAATFIEAYHEVTP